MNYNLRVRSNQYAPTQGGSMKRVAFVVAISLLSAAAVHAEDYMVKEQPTLGCYFMRDFQALMDSERTNDVKAIQRLIEANRCIVIDKLSKLSGRTASQRDGWVLARPEGRPDWVFIDRSTIIQMPQKP